MLECYIEADAIRGTASARWIWMTTPIEDHHRVPTDPQPLAATPFPATRRTPTMRASPASPTVVAFMDRQ